MSREETNKLRYTIALIAEFALKFGLSERQSYNYMRRFKGVDFLHQYYDVLHTQSFDDATESIAIICQQNGGRINPYRQ